LDAATHSAGAGFSIREYRPEDFETLWRIDQRCFPHGIAYSQIELSSFITKRQAITLVAEFELTDNDGEGVPKASPDGRTAGFAVAHSIRHKYGRILTLDIVPEARRFGLGTKLMLACEDRLRSAGCGEAYLETAVNNEPALRLYRKLGYEIVRTLPEYYASHALDAFQMAKRL